MIPDSKEGSLSKEVINYIYHTGNRIPQSKFDLIEETKTKFPESAGMITYPPEAELLKILVQLTNSKRGIEIGVFTGLSSISIAEGLPQNGMLFCLDVSEEFTNLAKKYWKIHNVENKIELILGPGIETLNNFLKIEENINSFDFAYVDADKPNYINYYELLLLLLKPNGFIIFDNTLWSHKVVYDDKYNDESTVALRKLNSFLQSDSRVSINMLNIGDGITIVRKN